MKKVVSKKLEAEIKALESISDDEIDLEEMPEVLDWSNAVRGKFYRPATKSVKIDADVLTWFQSLDNQYQTHINNVLRDYMEHYRHNTNFSSSTANC